MMQHANFHPPGVPIVSLAWVDATPSGQAHTNYRKLFQYRYSRFFSRPPHNPNPKAAAMAAAGSDLDITGSAPANEWPAPPEVLGLLVSSDVHGSVHLSAFGLKQLAALSSSPPSRRFDGAQRCFEHGGEEFSKVGQQQQQQHQHQQPKEQNQQQQQQQQQQDQQQHQQNMQIQAHLAHDLQYLVTTSCSEGSIVQGGLGCMVRHMGAMHSQQQPLLQLSVLSWTLKEMLELAALGVTSASKEWSSAQQEVSKRHRQMVNTLEDHDPSATDPAGELACMLAAGHVSPGMHAFLTGTLTEHGLRRMAKMVDSAVQAVHAILLDQVAPAVEVATFVLGELRGLATGLGPSSASALGLQVADCRAAEVECSKLVLQAEALRLSLTRIGCQYRAFHTWLLKTVLLLEEEENTEGSDGPPQNAAALVVVSVRKVLDFLSSQFLEDAVAPDLQEPSVSPHHEGCCPASLVFDPVLPQDEIKALQDLMVGCFPEDSPASGKSEGNPSRPMFGAPPAAEETEEQASGSSSRSAWPSRPFSAQLQLVSELAKQLDHSVCSALSPACSTVLEVQLLPHCAQPSTPSLPGQELPSGPQQLPHTPHTIPNTDRLPCGKTWCVQMSQGTRGVGGGASKRGAKSFSSVAYIAVHVPAKTLSSAAAAATAAAPAPAAAPPAAAAATAPVTAAASGYVAPQPSVSPVAALNAASKSEPPHSKASPHSLLAGQLAQSHGTSGLLLARLSMPTTTSPSSSGGHQPKGGVQVEGLLVLLQPQHAILDIASYKDEHLALLLHCAHSPHSNSEGMVDGAGNATQGGSTNQAPDEESGNGGGGGGGDIDAGAHRSRGGHLAVGISNSSSTGASGSGGVLVLLPPPQLQPVEDLGGSSTSLLQACIQQGHVESLSSLSQAHCQQDQHQHQQGQEDGGTGSGCPPPGLRARGHGSPAASTLEQPSGDERACDTEQQGHPAQAFNFERQAHGSVAARVEEAVGADAFRPPLLMSGPRGVAVACTGGGKAVVLDMQEDEEPEEQEELGDGDDEGHAEDEDDGGAMQEDA
ncbi:anaphase-promoting complex, cyclosome, subunit 4-domain-containing protein [Dunaliella salina]|uniref:Anaphase-promoting complex subunit 4 n=1 Tax=Dunaliella salina TaxID=3046 RepID=A0ABQ7GPN7_DUNSA|nr:anaphase-promoting complex, cyclosome, subunit 4-domain-containing protein [Dunaliella salina]|eukprot:KAF5836570.1 anaphase-promoting complex, cyclosome, subunit 4-domain-containing protein [Dunaliella salina]